MKGDVLRVGVSRQPAKSPRGINGALDRCASPCSQMAKVELQRLSGNSERAPIHGPASLPNETKGHHFGRFALPRTA